MTCGEWHKMMMEQIAMENLMELLGKIEKLENKNNWEEKV